MLPGAPKRPRTVAPAAHRNLSLQPVTHRGEKVGYHSDLEVLEMPLDSLPGSPSLMLPVLNAPADDAPLEGSFLSVASPEVHAEEVPGEEASDAESSSSPPDLLESDGSGYEYHLRSKL